MLGREFNNQNNVAMIVKAFVIVLAKIIFIRRRNKEPSERDVIDLY